MHSSRQVNFDDDLKTLRRATAHFGDLDSSLSADIVKGLTAKEFTCEPYALIKLRVSSFEPFGHAARRPGEVFHANFFFDPI